ncbi:MAG: 50S ribosomal protein L11 methyltransferase [Anaerolineales bacterium]
MDENAWIEVSLTVDGEMAEAVAEVLARYAPDGVVIESTAVEAAPDDSQGHAVGPLRVCAYLPVDDRLPDVRRKLEEALWYLGRIRPLPEPEFRLVQQADWSESWKQHYQPVAIGERLMVVPAWLESPEPGRVAVRIDPGMAFGTGTHPTTQLCLELIERCFREGSQYPDTLIDVGCGSGILAVAALKLGARRALGVDVDAEAVQAARENATLNSVADRLEVSLGSVAEIRRGAYSIQKSPLVLANILAPVIIKLLDEGLGDLLLPGGSLVLSGILAEQSPDVESALRSHGLNMYEKLQHEDWVALLARLD